MKRRLILSFVAILSLVAVLPVQGTASALTGGIPECTSMPMGFQEAADVVRNQYPTGWIGQNDPSHSKYTGFFGKTTAGDMIIGWNGNGNNTQLDSATLTFVDLNLVLSPKESSAVLNSDGTYKGGVINDIDDGSIACIYQVAGDVRYDSSWTGPYYDDVSGLATAEYNGTVDCGNDSLHYLLITQSGNTRFIPLSYESVYRASWNYRLTGDSYMVTVGCGSSVAASYGTVSPLLSNDWICDTTGSPDYCILS